MVVGVGNPAALGKEFLGLSAVGDGDLNRRDDMCDIC